MTNNINGVRHVPTREEEQEEETEREQEGERWEKEISRYGGATESREDSAC